MKKVITTLSFILFLFSCNKEEEKVLTIDVSIQGKIIKTTTAELYFGAFYVGGLEKVRALYKPVNSNEDYQKIEINYGINGDRKLILSNLIKATRYELLFETYNDKSSVKTKSFYFTTKAVNFDYSKFYNNSQNYSNPFEIFSHTNKKHFILGQEFNEYNNIKVYLVNESKTDSIILPNQVVADSLKFSIPSDYLSQNPRESLKKAIIGVKIKDSYEYFLSLNGFANEEYNAINNKSQQPAIYKVYNSTPVLNSIEFVNETNNTCTNRTLIKFSGEFLGWFSQYYWRPSHANLVIFKQDGTLFDTYIYNYGSGNTSTCDYFYLNYVSPTSSDYISVGYHQSKTAFCKTFLPNGSYKMKLVFNYANGTVVETNLVPITKS